MFLRFYDPVAQLVEQRPFKAKVRGSSPRWVTTSGQAMYRLPRLFSKVRAQSLCGPSVPHKARGWLFGAPVWRAGESNFTTLNQENRRFHNENGGFSIFKRTAAVFPSLPRGAAGPLLRCPVWARGRFGTGIFHRASLISCDVITEGPAKKGYTVTIQKKGAGQYGSYQYESDGV